MHNIYICVWLYYVVYNLYNYMFVCLLLISIYLSIRLSMDLSFYLSTYRSIHLQICENRNGHWIHVHVMSQWTFIDTFLFTCLCFSMMNSTSQNQIFRMLQKRQIRRKSLQNVYHFTRTLPLVGFFYKFRHTFLNSSASFWCSVSNWLRGREAAKLQEYSPSPDGFFAGFWCHISGDFQGFNQQISGF